MTCNLYKLDCVSDYSYGVEQNLVYRIESNIFGVRDDSYSDSVVSLADFYVDICIKCFSQDESDEIEDRLRI